MHTFGSRSGDLSKGSERFPVRADIEALVLRDIEDQEALAACLDGGGAAVFEGDSMICGRSLLITTSGLATRVDFFGNGAEGSCLRSSKIIF
jgi:hypothetical protein